MQECGDELVSVRRDLDSARQEVERLQQQNAHNQNPNEVQQAVDTVVAQCNRITNVAARSPYWNDVTK